MSGIVNIKMLTDCMGKKNISVEDISPLIGMNKSTFYRKLKDEGRGFTVKDIHMICNVLNLSDDEAKAIFFTHVVA